MTRAAILAMGTPVALATKGTVRLARGIDLQHVDVVALHGKLRVHQPDDIEAAGQRLGLALDLGDDLGREGMGRQRAGGIAGMDAGLLDMLHDAGDEDRLAVGDGIDIDLDGVLQI